jgi:4-carboxymuconolactone decarboxylase
MSSMRPRVPPLDLADMTEEQREFYDSYATGFRAAPSATFLLIDEAGRLIGPPAVWIFSQPLGNSLQGLGTAIRYHLHFSERAQEIAILMVAHYRDSPFERFAHQQAGLKKGLTREDIDAILAGKPPALVSDEERAVYEVTRRILATGTLDAREYEKYTAVLPVAHLFELVTLIGYYSMLATQLSVFDIQPPAQVG